MRVKGQNRREIVDCNVWLLYYTKTKNEMKKTTRKTKNKKKKEEEQERREANKCNQKSTTIEATNWARRTKNEDEEKARAANHAVNNQLR